MLIKKTSDIKSSEITPKDLYLNRRKFLAGAAIAGAAAVAGVGINELEAPSVVAQASNKIDGIQKSQFSNFLSMRSNCASTLKTNTMESTKGKLASVYFESK